MKFQQGWVGQDGQKKRKGKHFQVLLLFGIMAQKIFLLCCKKYCSPEIPSKLKEKNLRVEGTVVSMYHQKSQNTH